MDTEECEECEECDEESSKIEEVIDNVSECCQKVSTEMNVAIENLKELNSSLSEQYRIKMQTMMEQIVQYKHRIKNLEKGSMLMSPPSDTSHKNTNRTEELKKRIKKLQDSVIYRNKRLKAMDENSKIERSERVKNDEVEAIAKVCFVFWKIL